MAPGVLIKHSLLDNKDIHQWLLQTTKVNRYKPFYFCHVNWDILNNHKHFWTMAYLTCVGRAMKLDIKISELDLIVGTLGEFFSTIMSHHPECNAGKHFIENITCLISSLNFCNYTRATRSGYLQIASDTQHDLRNDILFEINSMDWPPNNIIPNVAAAMRILYYISLRAVDRIQKDHYEFIVYIYISIAKSGLISDKLLIDIRNRLIRLGRYIEIDNKIILEFYRIYSNHLPIDLVEQHLQKYSENSIKIFVNILQTPGFGMTCFISIGRAMKIFWDFPWSFIVNIFQEETKNYIEALKLVNGNIFYPFRKDFGIVKGRFFRSLWYVARELLIEVKGEAELKFCCWPRVIRNQQIIDLEIRKYERDYGKVALNAHVNIDNQIYCDLIELINSDINREIFS